MRIRQCREPAYRAQRGIYINAGYGWTADLEASVSPRPTRQNPTGSTNEAMAKLGSVPLGKGRLWITGSKINQKEGKIECLQFSLEIVLSGGSPKGHIR
jgi:hypothetical protein